MPELPEVETIKRQMEPVITGRVITRSRVLDPLLIKPVAPASLTRKLKGERFAGISRRGKYLIFKLEGADSLVIHLRMTGKLTMTDAPITAEQRKYLRLILELDDGSSILFQDARRFGRAWIVSEKEASELDDRMGPEPLTRSFDANSLERMLKGRTRPIKSTLLDQGIIAGIGNIYADEALFGARIHPQRPSGSLSRKEIESLTISIKETLRRAIRLQGSSIDSYRDSRGERGRFQETFKVHRREGEPCPACGGKVKKIKVGGRGTYICPSCQKLT